MTAVKERFMQIIPEMQRDITSMTDSDVQKIINVYFQVRPNKTKVDKMDEFNSLMEESQQWAKDVGLTPDDITKAIKTVRQRKRQQA